MAKTWTEPIPIVAFVSAAATFKIHTDGRTGHKGNILLIMQPHGSKIGDADVCGWSLTPACGWSLTPAEVCGLHDMLTELIGDA